MQDDKNRATPTGGPSPAEDPAVLDKAFEALKAYDWGSDPRALEAIEKAALACRDRPEVRKDLEARLAAILKAAAGGGTGAPRAAVLYACRKLARIGTAGSVPALAALLADEGLSHLARYALEPMPGPEAGAALRAALARVQGKLQVGVIRSLGARRDAESVSPLAALLGDPSLEIVGAAAEALGEIGTSESARALLPFIAGASKELRPAAAAAGLACAERLAASGDKAGAVELYRALSSPELPEHVRRAATLGISRAEAPRPAEPPGGVSPEERAGIEAALPRIAAIPPRKPRKLLIFDLNVNYGGHRSIPHANLAFTLMGRKTGTFEAAVSRDPLVFEPESLRRFDAVFLNNTVGNLFEDPALRKSLVEFVYGGGGLMGVHGTTVAFIRWPGGQEDWPEFGLLLGGRGARHRESDERVAIRLDDPDHPLNRPFGRKGFEYRDEFFRAGDPYSRDRVRVLFSIDTEKTDLKSNPRFPRAERDDNDYALAWARSFGRGRVFYCTIAHNPGVFSDPRMLEFYLGAAQFVLGDLPAPTLPSARLTPAARAAEKLGWRLAATAYSFHKFTFFEAIEKTAQLGLSYMEGLSFQKVSREIPKDLDPRLTGEELELVRRKLDAAGIRLLTYYFHELPGDEAGCRKIFEFGRKLGIEAFLSEPKPESLDTIEKCCEEYEIDLAIHNHGKEASPHSWHPEAVLKLCRGRSRRIGACGDLGYWMRSGIDPVGAVKTLGDRLITAQVHDLHAGGPEGHDVPWGTGVGKTERFFEEVRRLGIAPAVFGLEYSYDWLDSLPAMARCRDFFDGAVLKFAGKS